MSDWTWRKSSRSAQNGACVEVGWQRSTRCESGACVEVATGMLTVAVRDSKDPAGGMLRLSRDAWLAFLAGVKAAEFDG